MRESMHMPYPSRDTRPATAHIVTLLHSRRISFNPSANSFTPLGTPTNLTHPTPSPHYPPSHGGYNTAWEGRGSGMCEGYKRAESEFLRGPREKESKFGDARDNYQLWSEAFEHSLSVLPGLSGIHKIHALVSHTKGEARETVLLYKNCTRHGTAEIMFE